MADFDLRNGVKKSHCERRDRNRRVGKVVTFPTVYCTPKNSKALPIGDGVPVYGTLSLGPGCIRPTAPRRDAAVA